MFEMFGIPCIEIIPSKSRSGLQFGLQINKRLGFWDDVWYNKIFMTGVCYTTISLRRPVKLFTYLQIIETEKNLNLFIKINDIIVKYSFWKQLLIYENIPNHQKLAIFLIFFILELKVYRLIVKIIANQKTRMNFFIF